MKRRCSFERRRNRDISATSIPHCLEARVFDDEGALLKVGIYYLLVYQIVALMEKRARELDNKPLGFAAGDCKEVLCFIHPACRAIKNKGKCRHPDLSRPSMESCGMDVFAMAADVGWDVYPLGEAAGPAMRPGRLCSGWFSYIDIGVSGMGLFRQLLENVKIAKRSNFTYKQFSSMW